MKEYIIKGFAMDDVNNIKADGRIDRLIPYIKIEN